MRVIATFWRGMEIKIEEWQERTHERLTEPSDSVVTEKSSNFMSVSSILSSSLEFTTNITPLNFVYSCKVNTVATKLHEAFKT